MNNPPTQASHSRIALLPFDVLLIIAHMFRKKDMVQFMTAFEHIPTFAPFKCLLKLNQLNAVVSVWPLHIMNSLSPENCELVREASFLSKTVTFSNFSDPTLDTVKACNITLYKKVMLNFNEIELTPESLIRLQDLRFSKLKVSICMGDSNAVTGLAFVQALSQIVQLRWLRLTGFDCDTFCRETLKSIGLLKNLNTLDMSAYNSDSAILEFQLLGESLKSTNITHLTVDPRRWDGLLALTRELRETTITDLVVEMEALVLSQNPSHIQQFLTDLARSSLKSLQLGDCSLPDDFAIQLSNTQNLNLKSLIFKDVYDVTIVGATALVVMNMPSLKLLEFRYREKNGLLKREIATLMDLKPPHFHLVIERS